MYENVKQMGIDNLIRMARTLINGNSLRVTEILFIKETETGD